MFNRIIKNWRIAIQTFLIIIILVAIKLVISHYDFEFVTVTPLYTSIVAGGIFLFSLILAGTLADYKESEKIPAEIAAACENIYHEGLAIKSTANTFALASLRSTLMEIITGFKQDIESVNSRTSLKAVTKLSQSFLEMDRLGVAPNYIAWLKSEQGVIRRNLMRAYYIQRINFLPSAYILVKSVIILVLALLMITNIEPIYESIIILVFLTYFFVYIMKLLGILEKPFQTEGKTMDDVSLFLLEELMGRLKETDSQ